MPEVRLGESELHELVSVGQRLASEIDIGRLLHEILETAGRLMDSPDGAVLLHDPVGDGLYFAAATGSSSAQLLREWGEASRNRVPAKKEKSKAGFVFSTGESLVEQTVTEDRDHFKAVDQGTKHTTQSMVCVPLQFADQTTGTVKRIGVVQILNKRSGAYTERERVLLERFAVYAAVAIRNAALIRDLLCHMGLYTSGNPFGWLERLNRPPQTATVTVMFADMRGFTQLLQVLSNPAEVQTVLSDFLTMLTKQVLSHGGVVNKFLGDGILAFFENEDGAERSVQCAFGMLKEFDEMRPKWNEAHSQDLAFLDMGVGLATGAVLIGAIGGGEVRDFTVMGTAVNLAAAYQNIARGGQRVVVDQATLSGAKEIVGHVEGPEVFELRKPDQQVGIRYKRYHVVDLKEASATAEGLAANAVKLSVFLCHSSEDKPTIRALYQKLREQGFAPWLDEEDLIPGQDWSLEIRKAVSAADAVVVCLSNRSVTKEGYLQRELRYALEVADEKPEGTIFLIPAKLEECSLPDRLKNLQWVNLFESQGYEKLQRALALRAQRAEV